MLIYVFAAAIGCFCLERLIPGWQLPAVRTWPFRVVIVNLVQLGVVLLAGVTWERWLASRSIFELSAHVSPLVGGLIAYFIATFVFYWWHRWRHEVDFLWRGFHQIHHSPQRIEVITSFYKHPLEMIANSIILPAQCLWRSISLLCLCSCIFRHTFRERNNVRRQNF